MNTETRCFILSWEGAKKTDQRVQRRRLISVFVVRMWRKQVFLLIWIILLCLSMFELVVSLFQLLYCKNNPTVEVLDSGIVGIGTSMQTMHNQI